MYLEKAKIQVVYASICKYLINKKKRKEIFLPIDILQDRIWKLTDCCFLTVNLKSYYLKNFQWTCVIVLLLCKHNLAAGSKSNTSFRSHKFQGQVFQKMDAMWYFWVWFCGYVPMPFVVVGLLFDFWFKNGKIIVIMGC